MLVNLDPTQGSEMKKTRPCVVISPNEMNQYLQTIVIAPMTTQSKTYPTRVPIIHNEIQGWVVLDQIRTIDKKRIIKTLEFLEVDEIAQLKKIVQETFVD